MLTWMSGGRGGVEGRGLFSLELCFRGVVSDKGPVGLEGCISVMSSSSISDPVFEYSSMRRHMLCFINLSGPK